MKLGQIASLLLRERRDIYDLRSRFKGSRLKPFGTENYKAPMNYKSVSIGIWAQCTPSSNRWNKDYLSTFGFSPSQS